MKVNVKALISIPFIISAAVAMTGCRTVPQNSQDMTCEDLNYLADEAVETKGVPFFFFHSSNIPETGVLVPKHLSSLIGLKTRAADAFIMPAKTGEN